ncbi:MAG TPA: hypothetical protein DHW25_02855 [Blautia sp.]|nr:hypothetical protein [Blautia sp.]
MNMKNLQPQAYIKNNKIHKKSHRRFWGSACLFLSIFLLPVSVTATSAADDESIFVSSDADAPSPDSSAPSPDFDDTASDLDGFFSGDGTNDSARDNTIHVIIENENPSNESNPGDVYTAPDTAGYAGGDSSESPSSGQVILHKPQLLLEDSNLSSQSLQAGRWQSFPWYFQPVPTGRKYQGNDCHLPQQKPKPERIWSENFPFYRNKRN